MDDELTWSLEEHAAAVTLVVRGALTRSANTLDRVLRTALLDRGRLVVDVTQVRVLWRPALASSCARLVPNGPSTTTSTASSL